MESQNLIPLDYGSELRDIIGITKLFSNYKDKYIMVYIIQSSFSAIYQQ